mgnify:CR=1 FL=1
MTTLEEFLASHERARGELGGAVSRAVLGLAAAAVEVRRAIDAQKAALSSQKQESVNADGDVQRSLDLQADEAFFAAARQMPVALYASEEQPVPVRLAPDAPLALAIDPLDGSSNIDCNVSIGTIFSILPKTGAPDADPVVSFLQCGREQLAAGFFVYGPQLTFALTLGAGAQGFVFSPEQGTFVAAQTGFAVAPDTSEFAINASNYRHWDEPVRLYIDDCLTGADGPRGKAFNMRWVASLVAEAWRILVRGGVFLYPGDMRVGYGKGRLRLVYEANPIAMLIEQAGGAATDTVTRILDLKPESLHQRAPLVFGAGNEVARIARYHTDLAGMAERSPLFGHRSLFRA